MCVVCGCNANSAEVDVRASTTDVKPHSRIAEGEARARNAPCDIPGASDPGCQDLHFGMGDARLSVPGLSQSRTVRIEADVLGANQQLADANRAHFSAHGVTAYDLVSSPGSGKTTLLCTTIKLLKERRPKLPVAVIEGDQQTCVDADRIRATGVQAVQVNTGKGCHLDAQMVGEAFSRLHLHAHNHDHTHEYVHEHEHEHEHEHDQVHAHEHHPAENADAESPQALLLIENVGNLVCPAMWDLGEAAKIVVLSVTEGDDKPLKYPDMFASADLMIINKTDLLPYVDFSMERCLQNVRKIHPSIDAIALSATTGDGMEHWLDWLQVNRCNARQRCNTIS